MIFSSAGTNGSISSLELFTYLPGTDYINAKTNGTSVFLVTSNGVVTANAAVLSNLTASTVLQANAGKTVTSIANASGALTNNGTGTVGWYNNYPTLDSANVFTGSNDFTGTISANQVNLATNVWAGPTGDVSLATGSQDYITTTAMSITGFTGKSAKFDQHVTLTVSNSTGSDVILYLPSGVTTDDGLRSYTVTNKLLRVFSLRYNAVNYTNVVSRGFF